MGGYALAARLSAGQGNLTGRDTVPTIAQAQILATSPVPPSPALSAALKRLDALRTRSTWPTAIRASTR